MVANENEILPWCGIYMVINLDNGKYYIGQTKRSFNKRWREEVRDAPKVISKYHTNKFANAICKLMKLDPDAKYIKISDTEAHFGYFHFEKIDEWYNKLTQRELDNYEVDTIKYFDSYNTGYNSNLGGKGSLGYKPSEETRDKLSKISKDRWKDPKTRKKILDGVKVFWETNPGLKEKASHFFKELWKDPDYKNKQSQLRKSYWDSMTEVEKRKKHHHIYKPKTDEEKQHLRKKNSTPEKKEFMRTIQKMSAEKCKKCVIAYKEGKLYGPYESIIECDKSLFDKTQNPHITDCLKENRVHVQGYMFREISPDDNLEDAKKEIYNSISKIIISKKDELERREYETIELLLKDFPNLTRSEIHRCAKNGNKHKGYKIEKTPGKEIRLQTGAIGKKS
jgi:hypothetical protein